MIMVCLYVICIWWCETLVWHTWWKNYCAVKTSDQLQRRLLSSMSLSICITPHSNTSCTAYFARCTDDWISCWSGERSLFVWPPQQTRSPGKVWWKPAAPSWGGLGEKVGRTPESLTSVIIRTTRVGIIACHYKNPSMLLSLIDFQSHWGFNKLAYVRYIYFIQDLHDEIR